MIIQLTLRFSLTSKLYVLQAVSLAIKSILLPAFASSLIISIGGNNCFSLYQ